MLALMLSLSLSIAGVCAGGVADPHEGKVRQTHQHWRPTHHYDHGAVREWTLVTGGEEAELVLQLASPNNYPLPLESLHIVTKTGGDALWTINDTVLPGGGMYNRYRIRLMLDEATMRRLEKPVKSMQIVLTNGEKWSYGFNAQGGAHLSRAIRCALEQLDSE